VPTELRSNGKALASYEKMSERDVKEAIDKHGHD
jgi:hypothetical protein